MQSLKERLSEFLFPTESDAWLSILRVGLGFQITLYSLSLRNDWNYLFAGADSGLVNRDLAEALLSVESRFAPRLGWFATLGAHVGLREETVLSILWFCLFVAGCGLIAGIFQPHLCDSGLVSSSLRSQERGICLLTAWITL